jgi:hypothetical protein
MPTKQYTITILNGLLQGKQYIRYSTYEVDGMVEYLDQMGYSVSVKEQSLSEESKRMQELAGLKTDESFIFEANLSKNYEKGDKVRITNREGIKQLIGKEGIVVGKDEKKGIVYVDFGEKISGDGFSTHRCGGLLSKETGLLFQDRGWVTSKLDSRFDIRNIKKIEH